MSRKDLISTICYEFHRLFMKARKGFFPPYNHEQQVNAFFTKGQSCIESAEALFKLQESSKRGLEYIHYEYEILLIHGIELLLDFFILMKDISSFDKKMKKLRDYQHKYKKIFNQCLKFDKDNIFSNEELKSLIYSLSDNFYPDTITARFPKKDNVVYFSKDTFRILKDKLIKPLNILRINYWNNIDCRYRQKKEIEHHKKREEWWKKFNNK